MIPSSDDSPRSWTLRTLGPMKRGSLRGSIFTLMSAAIGSGVLLLPYAFSLVGVPIGILTLLFGTYCLATSLRLIITISHITGRDSYAKSAIVVLGPTAGRALACLMVGEALCGQAAFIKFLSDLWPRVLPFAFRGFSKGQMALVVVAAAFPAAASRDMSVLRHVTVISFLSLAFMASLVVTSAVTEPEALKGDPGHVRVLTSGRNQNFWEVLPQTWSLVLSALYCQHVAIPVYKQLNNFNSRRINKVLLRSCTSLSLLYALVATCGVMAHGAKTPENILLAYPSSHGAAWLAQLLTGCSLLIALPLGVHPTRDQLPEVIYSFQCLFRAVLFGRPKLPPGSPSDASEFAASPSPAKRVLHTAAILGTASTLAVIFPSVTSIVSIATGFGSVLWTFVMPMVMIFILRNRASRESASMLPELSSSTLKRERLLSSPLASPVASPSWSPRGSTRSSPQLSPRDSRAPVEEFQLEEVCMEIEEPDSGVTSTVRHAELPVLPVLPIPAAEPERPPVNNETNGPHHWSLNFAMGIFSLSIGSVLGLTAAYQSCVKVLRHGS